MRLNLQALSQPALASKRPSLKKHLAQTPWFECLKILHCPSLQECNNSQQGIVMPLTNVCRIDSYSEIDRIEKFIFEALSSSETVTRAMDKPEAHVVLKPNWVQESHEYQAELWLPVITHPAILEATIKALSKIASSSVKISICDAPHTYANFKNILGRGNLEKRIDDCRKELSNIHVEIIDLRREVWIRREEVVVDRRKNTDDPRSYVALNLGRDSLFYGFHGEGHYYGADYDAVVVNEHHQGETQEYLIAGTPMKCDLFINLPKLKTHKKTGITCSLKNLVGINGDKNWLPHHTEGVPRNGGDEFPEKTLKNTLEGHVKKIGKQVMQEVPVIGNWIFRKARSVGKAALGSSESVVRNGNWIGNNTCWRMALDLNRALLYGNPDGTWRDHQEIKPYFTIVDGIVAGQGNGPICPDAADARALIAGENPAVVDAVCAQLMGFDPEDIPIVKNAFSAHRWPIGQGKIADIVVQDRSNGQDVAISDLPPLIDGGFIPHFGWTNLCHPSATS
jgi:uncharacterized protein (DUF362 family)